MGLLATSKMTLDLKSFEAISMSLLLLPTF